MADKPIQLGHISNTNSQANRVYSVKGKSVCLQSQSGGGGAKTGLYKIDLPDGDYLIRKLYPLEAERLQTLPDGYTEGISDTQRFKCIGNGWTVDVIAHILSYLPKEELMEKQKSIVEILNEVVDDICNNYCKYPSIWDEEKEGCELCESEICQNCPLNRLV